MGSGQVDYFPSQKKEEELSYAEIITRLCPDYLAMGMTLSEYYDCENPDDYESVRQAHLLRLKQKNHDAWLNGLYTYHALQRVSPMFRDWVKDHTAEKYMEEPFDLYPNETAVSKTEEERIEDAKELANQATIRAWIDKVNRLKSENKKEGVANG